VAEAARFAVEVAGALERAHRDQVIHRDIKPENIMLDGGVAVVTDFGIARVPASGDDAAITRSGLLVGTPQYMSPEQGAGDMAIDARSDVYALGCVLYEMLTGQPPFQGNVLEVLRKHAIDPAPDPRALRAETPELLALVTLRALEKDPERRFGSAQEFAEAINAVMAASGGAEGVGGSLWGRLRSMFAGPAPAAASSPQATPGPLYSPIGTQSPFVTTPAGRVPIDSLAVLPFAAASGDEDGAYLAEGITESIMHRLAGIAGLRIVPRSVVFRYAGSDRDPIGIAREVHARAVVTGRVRHRGERLSITAELVDAGTESQLWGERYDRTISDIFAVQEEMAAEIARSLRLRLTGDEARQLAKRETENSDAYRAYLKGRHHWNKRTVDGLRQAIVHFQEAIDLDPGFALAYGGLADTWNILGYYNSQPPLDAYPRGKAAAQRAIELDPAAAAPHASLGYVQVFFDRDWPGAKASFERAIELDPGYATAHQWYAWYLFVEGKYELALAAMRRALELDPLSLIINDHMGYALLLAGRPQEALQQLQRALELDPSFPWTYWRLGQAHIALGQAADAVRAYRTVVERTGAVVGAGYLAVAAAAAGDRALAEEMLARLEALAPERYVSPLELALVLAALGRHDEGFAALDRAFTERSSDVVRLGALPWPDPFRSDPRFAEAVARLQLPA
jgi:serine/threonine-protein kinase